MTYIPHISGAIVHRVNRYSESEDEMANAGTFKKGHKALLKAGRPKGVVNKATADIRQAIAKLLEDNTENFNRWLSLVASGDGGDLKPDPAKALDLVAKLAEFHVPRLARSEVSGTAGGEPVRLIIG